MPSRYFSRFVVEEGYAADEVKEDGSHWCWLACWESYELKLAFEAYNLLSSVLLDNSASPLLRGLENRILVVRRRSPRLCWS